MPMNVARTGIASGHRGRLLPFAKKPNATAAEHQEDVAGVHLGHERGEGEVATSA